MKTLTNESTKLFFAQNFGAEVKYSNKLHYGESVFDAIDNQGIRIKGIEIWMYFKQASVIKTPLQNISDEHAIEVAKLSGWDVKNHIEYSLKRIKEQLKNNNNDILISLFSFQYLQSKGYALDYFCPIENRIIPVQEQIDNGWITLKNE